MSDVIMVLIIYCLLYTKIHTFADLFLDKNCKNARRNWITTFSPGVQSHFKNYFKILLKYNITA